MGLKENLITKSGDNSMSFVRRDDGCKDLVSVGDVLSLLSWREIYL
jgi:hypothetical protein